MAIAAAVAMGCAGLAGCGPRIVPRLFVIGAPAPPAPGIQVGRGPATIELKPVSVPDYLDTTDILHRTGPNELTASPTGQWGERLSLGLTDALVAALSRLLPQRVVTTRPVAAPAWRIVVEIERIDIGAGVCLLSARWSITGHETAAESAWGHGTFSAAATTTDDAAVAAAMSGLVNQLAEQIVAAFAAD